MKKAAVLRGIPVCIRQIGPVDQLFLDEKKSVGGQPVKLRKILEAIWDILSVFYPLDRTGDTILEIPSNRLADLGLVSSATKARIERRKQRRQREGQYAADTSKNVLLIMGIGTDFVLTETYVTEEEILGSGIRRDCVVRDRICLTKGEEFVISIEREMEKYHIHALNAIWHLEEQESDRRQATVEVTARRVNIILALLLEGIVPGYLNGRSRN